MRRFISLSSVLRNLVSLWWRVHPWRLQLLGLQHHEAEGQAKKGQQVAEVFPGRSRPSSVAQPTLHEPKPVTRLGPKRCPHLSISPAPPPNAPPSRWSPLPPVPIVRTSETALVKYRLSTPQSSMVASCWARYCSTRLSTRNTDRPPKILLLASSTSSVFPTIATNLSLGFRRMFPRARECRIFPREPRI